MKTLLATLLLVTSLFAQIPIRVTNLSQYPRRESWVTFVVPDKNIPENPVVAGKNWLVAFGSQSGVKGRYVHIFYDNLEPAEVVTTQIIPNPNPPAASPPAIGPTAAPVEAHYPFRLIAYTAEGSNTWEASEFIPVEVNTVRSVYHSFGRIPNTMLVVHVWFYVYTNQTCIPFEVMISNADQSNTEYVQNIERLELRTNTGYYPSIDFLTARGGEILPQEPGNPDYIAQILENTWFGNCQGAAWTGRMVQTENIRPEMWLTMAADLETPVCAIAGNWDDSWGPWGVTPKLHPTDINSFDYYLPLWSRFLGDLGAVGTVWAANIYRYGLNESPSGTGAQQDFGVTKLLPALGVNGGNPAHLYEVLPSVLRDVGRQTFPYESDGSPLDIANHPQWATWGLVTHYHNNVSKDRLGKPGFGIGPTNTLYAKDFAHASSNNLAGWTCLTGSYLGKHICSQEITHVLAFGRYFGIGQTRAWGRTPLLLTWNYLATNDARAPTVLPDIYNHGWFDNILTRVQNNYEVTPLSVSSPDSRYLNGAYPYINCWHEGLAVVGLDAATTLYTNERIESVLLHACKAAIEHYWYLHEGRWTIPYAMRWLEDGSALPPEAYQDPSQVAPSWPGTDFDLWCWGSVIVAERRLRAAGETVLADKAKTISDFLMAFHWTDKVNPGIHQLPEWNAVK